MTAEAQFLYTLPSASERLYDTAQLEEALDAMAEAINRDLSGRDALLVLVVMNGGLVTAGKLLPRLNFLLEVDYVHATRYGDQTYGGELRWQHEPNVDLEGRRVLFLDDILDRGITLQALVDYARQKGAVSVHTAVLVQKSLQERPAVTADFLGLTVPDCYVYGFGMDYRGYWRNAPGIFVAPEEV